MNIKTKDDNTGQSVKKNFIYNTIGTGFYMICQWLTTILVVRLSGYADSGILSLAMSITSSFVCIALYGIRSYQVSDLTSKYKDGTYISSRIITSIASIAFCAIFVVANPYSQDEILCILFYMILKVSEALVDVLHGIDQKAWRLDIAGKSYIIRGILTLAAFSLILGFTSNLLLSIAGMAVCSFLVILLYDIPKTRKITSIKPNFSFHSMRKLLMECFPLLIFFFIAALLPMIPRYFLESYHGNVILGIYAAVATPTLIVQVAATFIFNPLITLFAEYHHSRNHRVFKRTFIKCILAIGTIAVAAFVVGAIWGDWGLNLLFGKDILPYTYLLLPIILCTVLTAFNWFLSTILTIVRDFKRLIIGNTTGLAICLVLSMLLIHPYQMNGVNITLICAMGSQSILLLIFVLYQMHKTIKPAGPPAQREAEI